MTDYYLLGKFLSTGPSSFQTTSKSNSTTLESQRVTAHGRHSNVLGTD